jgi:hypothetical protein
MSKETKIKFAELTESQKTELARDIAKIWVSVWNEQYEKMMFDLFTPFYIRWFYWIRNKIQGANKQTP